MFRCAAITALCLTSTLASAQQVNGTEADDFFERKVRPLLVKRCFQCHSESRDKRKGELVLDAASGVRRGGERGPAVVAGNPDESLLIQAVRYGDEELQMPPSKKLSDAEIAILVKWVSTGAPFPETKPLAKGVGRDFWSFQPPTKQLLPETTDRAWPRRKIDWFILGLLEDNDLSPSDEADKRTLIRRVYFDLIGLPPTTEEVQAFIADESLDAYERLVDRLLASPHYGERWARYWLDLARYTDSTASWLKSTGQAWRYRDWVAQALNDDVPYDDFVRRQFATDMMESTGPEDLPALGFLGLSPTYWKEPRLAPDVIKVIVAEEWEERIDAVSRTFLGLTVACARCHDHKFDPITMEDYYGLAGVFANTQLADRPMLPKAEAAVVKAAHKEVKELEEQVTKIANSDKKRAEELKKRVEEIRKATPHFDVPQAQGVEEAAIYVLPDGLDATKVEYHPGEVRELALFERGNPNTPGNVVPRRFVSVLSRPESQPFQHGSGRLELAEAIVGDGMPLASRVIVNRVWRHHFGRGLVTTPSNFGTQGELPSHPALLDDLSARFVENGWSIKWLHREILLSATYRQSSRHDDAKHSLDPDNRLLWRMSRRRLDIEAWRDTLLTASQQLDMRIGGAALPLDVSNRRRTLYGKVERRELNDMLRLYDFPQPTSHSPGRALTTTPLQQLFVLNSEFVDQQAASITERVSAAEADAAARVKLVYSTLFQRQPAASELELAKQFVAEGEPAGELWQQYVHTLLGTNEFMFID